MSKIKYAGTTVAAQFAEMQGVALAMAAAMGMGDEFAFSDLDAAAMAAIEDAGNYKTFMLDMLGLDAAADLPEDPKTALQEMVKAQQAEIVQFKAAAETAEADQTKAVEDAEAALTVAHTAKMEETETAHAAALADVQAKLDAAEHLAAEQGKKLEDPAYKMASIEGQEPVETAGEAAEDGTLYQQYCELKKSDPVAASTFWRKNRSEILESAR